MTDKLLSKIRATLLVTIASFTIAACTATPEPQAAAHTLEYSIPPFEFESLNEQEKADFDIAFPADARLAFENAEVISILSKLGDKKPIQITLAKEKRSLLDALY